MKLDHALLDQVFQQLALNVIGWLSGLVIKALRRHFGSIVCQCQPTPAAAAEDMPDTAPGVCVDRAPRPPARVLEGARR